jgi:hypothetical protein
MTLWKSIAYTLSFAYAFPFVPFILDDPIQADACVHCYLFASLQEPMKYAPVEQIYRYVLACIVELMTVRFYMEELDLKLHLNV